MRLRDAVVVCCTGVALAQPLLATAASALENPQPGSFQSGIGLLSGWSCQGPAIAVSIDGAALSAPYGSARADTAASCGAGNTNTGFGLLFNFNTLTPGSHSAQLFVNGEAQGAATQFTVTVPAGEFLAGVTRELPVSDFPSPGRTTVLVWQQSQQNFAIESATEPSKASAAQGIWNGNTSSNQSVRAIILEDGTYYVVYSEPSLQSDGGVVQGTSSADNGKLNSSDALDFLIASEGETNGVLIAASLSGDYVPRTSLQLTITEPGGNRTASTTYDPGYEQPADLSAVAGAYTGRTGHIFGSQAATFSIDGSGNITGHNGACNFTGTIVPHANSNLFDFTVAKRGVTACIFGAGPIKGIAYYDPGARKFRGFASFVGRVDQYFMIGTK